MCSTVSAGIPSRSEAEPSLEPTGTGTKAVFSESESGLVVAIAVLSSWSDKEHESKDSSESRHVAPRDPGPALRDAVASIADRSDRCCPGHTSSSIKPPSSSITAS